MIKSIDEDEVERLLETAEKLIEVCKKNGGAAPFSAAEMKNMEDQAYYFRKAFEKRDFSFQCCQLDDDDDDDDDDYDD